MKTLALISSALFIFMNPNPLDRILENVKFLLSDAGLPFTPDQERAITLIWEEQKQVTEELYGYFFDFKNGPPQGRESDRANAAISWMEAEFCRKLRSVLRPEQAQVLDRSTCNNRAGPGQTAEVRINNNPVSAESGLGETLNTGVIDRAGRDRLHGSAESAFNAGARNFSVSIGGPVIRDRLSVSVLGDHNHDEQHARILAFVPGSVLAQDLVQPLTSGAIRGHVISQSTSGHAVHFDVRRAAESAKNLGAGEFVLPERASGAAANETEFNVRHIWTISDRTIYENLVRYREDDRKTHPVNDAPAIDVLDSFSAGGGLDRSQYRSRRYEFGNLLYRVGNKQTIRSGIDGSYEQHRSLTDINSRGTFTFASLENYLNGQPLMFRMRTGVRPVELNQVKASLFTQHDINLTRRFRLMLGARYERQNDLSDSNNLDPRAGIAYALARSTVIRANSGVFHQKGDESIMSIRAAVPPVQIGVIRPSYPNPFRSSMIITFPQTLRLLDKSLVMPYYVNSSVSVERSLAGNLFVAARFEHRRGVHLFRTRNVNAPLSELFIRPDPAQWNVLNLESTGMSTYKSMRLEFRERFGMVHIAGQYALSSGYSSADGPFSLPSNNYDLASDWGRMPSLPKHAFSAVLNSRLPLGIYAYATLAAHSGNPYNITTVRDDNGDSTVNDRPKGVPRNSGDGPAFFDTSLTVSKAFFFRDGAGANVNVFANLSKSREKQFGVRFRF